MIYISTLATSINQILVKPKFIETLKFFQWWNFLFLVSISAIFLFLVYGQMSRTELDGNVKNGLFLIFAVIVSILLISVFLVGYLLIRLRTEINVKGIQIKFTPFINKTFKWTEIKSAEIVTCKVFAEWSLKGWKRYGVYRNNKGNKALALILADGKKLLIGTQKESELIKILEKMPVANKGYNSLLDSN